MSSFQNKTSPTITIENFSKSSDLKNWRVVNDDVMGGVSKSKFIINKEGNGSFYGTVSTANYGGFASIRCSMSPIEINNSKYVKLRIKGDGKKYQFRMKHRSSDYHSYIQTFTTNGEWQTIEIDLSNLYPSFRGRKLNMSNFKESTVEEISILIGNKLNESFILEIDKITLE